MKKTSFSIAVLAFCLAAPVLSHGSPVNLLDNTSNLTGAIQAGTGSEVDSLNWTGFSFTVGANPLQLSSLTAPFKMVFNQPGGTFQFTVNLYQAAPYNPSGAALASVSQSISIVGTGSFQTFDLSTLPQLAASTSYSLVIGSDCTGFPYPLWGDISGKPGYTDLSYNSDIVQNSERAILSFDSGATWYDNTLVGNIDGLQLQGSVVPEPSTYALFGVGALAFLAWSARQKKQLRAVS